MAIPNRIPNDMISGIVGEVAFDGPTRAMGVVLDSADASNNIFGRAFTYNDTAVESIQAGGSGVFAGILIHPKAYAIDGLSMANGAQAEALFMGEVYATINNITSADIGTLVYYSQATGELSLQSTGENPQIVGGTISTSISTFKTITAGTLKLSLDGGAVNTTSPINLGSVSDYAGVAAAVQSAVRALGGTQYAASTVVYDASSQVFVVKGDTAGAAVVTLTSTPLSAAMGLDTGTNINGTAAPTAVPNCVVSRHLPSAEQPHLVVIKLTN